MTDPISLLVRVIGLPGLILLGGYVYYEGLPGFARIPYLASVPVLGDLTTGRVAVERAEAMAEGRVAGQRAERAIWEEARRKAEALNAQRLADAQAQINQADRELQAHKTNERRRAEAIRRAFEERSSDDKTAVPGCDFSRCLVPDRVRRALE